MTAEEILLKVRGKILASPDSFSMGYWYIHGKARVQSFFMGVRRPACNTVACIGGWIVDLTGGYPKDQDSAEFTSKIAAERLGVPPGDLADLFHVDRWPDDLMDRHVDAVGDFPAQAHVAAEAIDRFISEHKEELNRKAVYRGV